MTTGYPDWLRAFLLLGKYGTDYLPILLGPDGSMYAVLQGEYAGVLKTLKTDDQGQLYTLLLDPPDVYGQTLRTGIAELAARLGASITYDHRGQLIWWEGFEFGRGGWDKNLRGANAAADIDYQYRIGGAYSIKLVGGSDGDRYASLSTMLTLPPGVAHGLGLFFSLDGEAETVTFIQAIVHGDTYYEFGVRYTYATTTLSIYVPPAAWQTIAADVLVSLNASAFNFLKVVGDYTTGHYVRLLFGEREFDISAYVPFSGASEDAPILGILIEVVSRPGNNDRIYVDSISLTTMEPPN